jgi:hypothetical protein
VKLPGKRTASSAADAASRQLQTLGTFLQLRAAQLSCPLSTVAICIDKGATTSKTEIVGAYSPFAQYQGGFLARVSRTKTVTETHQAVSYPLEPADQWATCVNDLGQIVGTYIDSSGVNNGYERRGGKFTTLNVPFSGATGTFHQSINDWRHLRLLRPPLWYLNLRHRRQQRGRHSRQLLRRQWR